MKKIKVLICFIVLMILATGCVQTGDDFKNDGSNSTPEINGFATGNSGDLFDVQGEEPLDGAIVPDEAAIDTKAIDPESLLFFDPEALYLGRVFSDVNEMYPDLEFSGNLTGGSWFYCADKDMYFIFTAYAQEYPDKSAIDAIIETVKANAEDIFPNMTEKISKEVIEQFGVTEWHIYENGDDAEMYPEKAYVASFEYSRYKFWYYPDDLTGEILCGHPVFVQTLNIDDITGE